MSRPFETYPVDELMRDEPRYEFRSCESVTLKGPVSAVFKKAHFVNIDFDLFYPVLELASLILETPCSMAYWYAACLAEPREVQYANGQGSYRALFRKDEPVDEQDKSRIGRLFAELGPRLRFEQSQLQGRYGECEVSSQHVLAEGFPVPCIGYGSTILLESSLYRELVDFQQQPEHTDEQLDRLFSLKFLLACIFLHELVHAVSYA